jgi:hypothetical protein
MTGDHTPGRKNRHCWYFLAKLFQLELLEKGKKKKATKDL